MKEQEFKRKSETFLMWYAVIISCVGVTAMVFIILQYLGEVCL